MENKPTVHKIFYFSIFIIPSLLCLGFYYFAIRKPLTTGKTNIFVLLPHYGPAKLEPGSTDSVFYTVPPFQSKGVDGTIVSTETLKNQIYLVSFLNSKDLESTQISSQLYRVQAKLGHLKKEFQIITLLTDASDSLQKVDVFTNKVHANPKMWWAATSSQNELQSLLTEGLLLPIEKSTVLTSNLWYSSKLVLIDKKNQIRGYYDGKSVKEVNRLIDEVVVLAAEYGKFKNM